MKKTIFAYTKDGKVALQDMGIVALAVMSQEDSDVNCFDLERYWLDDEDKKPCCNGGEMHKPDFVLVDTTIWHPGDTPDDVVWTKPHQSDQTNSAS